MAAADLCFAAGAHFETAAQSPSKPLVIPHPMHPQNAMMENKGLVGKLPSGQHGQAPNRQEREALAR